MSTLESRGYVATDEDIRDIASGFLDALSNADGSRRSYLRALIGTTQHELGITPRTRPGKPQKLDDETLAKHLAVLEAVHERFYKIVFQTTAEKIPPGPNKPKEVNRRTNYARTSMFAIRTWIRAGNDISTLVPAKVTKGMLAVQKKRRRPSTSRLATRAERQTAQLLRTVKILASTDREAAVSELEALMRKLAAQITELGARPTRDPREAAAEGRPLRVGSTVFLPARAV